MLRVTSGSIKEGLQMIDDKTMNYLAVVSISIDFYKEGYLTDEEYEAVEEKIAKKCGINQLNIYRLMLKDIETKIQKNSL